MDRNAIAKSCIDWGRATGATGGGDRGDMGDRSVTKCDKV